VTTLTVPARPEGDATLPPVPWRRMAWVTWRQHRLALAGVAALFGVAAVYLLITGLQLHQAYAAVAACRPAGSATCRQVAGNFLNTYAPGVGSALGLLQVIPGYAGGDSTQAPTAKTFPSIPSVHMILANPPFALAQASQDNGKRGGLMKDAVLRADVMHDDD